MPQSRRTRRHPPVSSTAEHAATETAFLSTSRTKLKTPIPATESPAVHYAPTPSARVVVTCLDDLPERLRGLVAEPVTVRLLP